MQHTQDVVWPSNHRVSVPRTEDKIGTRGVGTAPVSPQTVHTEGNSGKTVSATATAFSQKISSELGPQGTSGCLREILRTCEKNGTSVTADNKAPNNSNDSHCSCHYPSSQQYNQTTTALLKQSDTQNTSETTTRQTTDSDHCASRTGQEKITIQNTNTTSLPGSHNTGKTSGTRVNMMPYGHSSPSLMDGSLSIDNRSVNGGQCEHNTRAPAVGLDRTTDSGNGQADCVAG